MKSVVLYQLLAQITSQSGLNRFHLPEKPPEDRRSVAPALEVLSDVLLVLVPLLLAQLTDLVLQLDNGSLQLVVLADQ